jgi:guanosine-3',5'-bis(diphosphate) 3'-pyrophosphohydrolase
MLDPRETDARVFAQSAHASQKYGDAPYDRHLTHVRSVLADFGYGGALGVAAWLHDVIEDAGVTKDDVEARFGGDVAELVWAVTGEGADRKERNATAYAKIRAHPAAAILKLADRIANVEASRAVTTKLAMYRSEWQAFRKALGDLGDPRMWARLERGIAGGPS